MFADVPAFAPHKSDASFLRNLILTFRFRTGERVHAEVMSIINRQAAIEAESYDAKTGLLAVSSAQLLVEHIRVEKSPSRQLEIILDALEDLSLRQRENRGHYSTGSATIGSIISRIKARFGA